MHADAGGKSAILTAITIALGGKATTTSRGSNLKDLVREGATWAEVRVHLRNRGADAFRPDKYGARITVERRIQLDGAGSWKIRNADGKTISSKREELDAICDHANIQVDNPMNVLSQDAARQFLGSSQAEDKYSFFLRGTQLTQLAQEYELIQTNIQRMRRTLALAEEALPDLERAARDASARWQQIEHARAEQAKLDALKEELVWSQVIAKEKELAAAAEALQRTRTKHEALTRKKAGDEARAAELDGAVAELESRSREGHERERQLQEQRAAAVARVREHKSQLSGLRAQERELNEQAERVQRTIRQLQAQIDQEARRQAQDRRAEREAQEARRDALQRERLEVEMRQVALAQEGEALAQTRRETAAEHARLAAERQTVEEKQAHLHSFLQRCEDASRNRITAFGGASMPHVMRAIERETRWRAPPVGPIGAHVRLRDARWAPVVESVLSDALNAFVVQHHEDRARLARILKECRATNQIITAAHDFFDYSSGEPDASVLTLLRVLDTDEYLCRVLIDGHKIEKSALVHRRAQGDELVRRRPRNVQQCFSLDMFKITGGPSGSATQTITPYAGAPRFARDTHADMDEARRALAQHDETLSRLRERLAACADDEAEHTRTQRELDAQGADVRAALRDIRQRMAQVEDEMREDEPANVAALEEARADADEEMARIVERFRETEAQKEEAEHALAGPAHESAQLQEQLGVVEARQRELEAELETTYTERVRLQRSQQHWTQQIEQHAAMLAEGEREEQSLAALVDVRASTHAVVDRDGHRLLRARRDGPRAARARRGTPFADAAHPHHRGACPACRRAVGGRD